MIIDNHLKAYKNNNFDYIGANDLEHLEVLLLAGKTIEKLFNSIVDRKLSITTQIMMSNRTFCHLSNQGRVDLTNGFKEVFRSLNIK